MIFGVNESYSADYYDPSLDEIKESPYPLGLEGGLMHIYETECNYNAMMKSVGISEYQYYLQTGKDLFLNEAGAFKSFIEKAKALFKKIIEKVKQIFKKFMMTITSYFGTDKEFVNKYGKDLRKITNLRDFEFKGYDFEHNKTKGSLNFSTLTTNIKNLKTEAEKLKKFKNVAKDGITTTDNEDRNDDYYHSKGLDDRIKKGTLSDFIEDEVETQIGGLIGKNSKYTQSEMLEELQDMFYGEKEDVGDKYTTTKCLQIISSAKQAIKDAERESKEITRAVNEAIKHLESLSKELDSAFKSDLTDKQSTDMSTNQQITNAIVNINRQVLNAGTAAYSFYVKFLKDENRQAKAFCIKALGYKPKD